MLPFIVVGKLECPGCGRPLRTSSRGIRWCDDHEECFHAHIVDDDWKHAAIVVRMEFGSREEYERACLDLRGFTTEVLTELAEQT